MYLHHLFILFKLVCLFFISLHESLKFFLTLEVIDNMHL